MTGAHDPNLVAWQVLVACWLVVVGAYAAWRLSRGDPRTMWFVQLVHVAFCGMPLALDLVVGPPVYTYQVGFAQSQFDGRTNVAYLAYISLVPLVLWWSGSIGVARVSEPPRDLPTPWWGRVLAWACLASPLATVALAPMPSLYLQPAAILGPVNEASRSWHVVVTMALNAATIAGAFVLATPGPLLARVVAVPLLSAALWIAGKRALVAMAAALVLFVHWRRGGLRGARLLVAGGMVAGGILLFSAVYERAFRAQVMGSDAEVGIPLAASTAWVNFRVDFGRDAVIKQAIFAELHPEAPRILAYRGQSLLFDLAVLVPRSLWPQKPLPYASYATSAMLGIPSTELGWGVTTSWLDEAIANAGWLGFLLGPLVPGLVCAIGDRRGGQVSRMLTVVVATLLLTVNRVAFLVLAAAWVVSLVMPAPGPRGDLRTG